MRIKIHPAFHTRSINRRKNHDNTSRDGRRQCACFRRFTTVFARGIGGGKTALAAGLPEGVYETATLEALPGKKPLIKLSYRPPNYETPLSHFTSEFTPNNSFFVRYHLSAIPEEIDAAGWKLKVGGEGIGKPLELSLSELR